LPRKRRRFSWRKFLRFIAGCTLLTLLLVVGFASYLHGQFLGLTNPLTSIFHFGTTLQTLVDPLRAFPERERINILLVGLDRDVFTTRDPKLRHLNGQPYTKHSRSDSMMVVSLDLANRTASILAIPRDTRVLLPEREGYSKINEAHRVGGIPSMRGVVEQFLSIPVDYHVVIRQEAVMAVVNALGGVRVEVARDMDYDDDWGQLHIHLKEGEQVLDGEQLVGYLRFRKDAEGDLGRMRRQQEVLHTLAAQAKDPSILVKADGVIKAIRQYIDTDLSPHQQLALAHLFHRADPGGVQSLSLPVAGTPKIGNTSYLVVDDYKKEGAVNWLLRGDPNGMNRLVRVKVINASGDRSVYRAACQYLGHYQFEVIRGGRARETVPTTRVVQHTKLRGSGRRVLDSLSLAGVVEREDARGADVTLVLGEDLIGNFLLETAKSWGEPPARPVQEMPETNRLSRRERRRRKAEEPRVTIQELTPDVEPDSPIGVGPARDEIGAAEDPGGKTEDSPGTEAPVKSDREKGTPELPEPASGT
jgi:LCP family protein required for cell wall assembly